MRKESINIFKSNILEYVKAIRTHYTNRRLINLWLEHGQIPLYQKKRAESLISNIDGLI